MPIDTCRRCGSQGLLVQKLQFRENMSYVFKRWERLFEGYICYPCMWIVFTEFTKNTLSGTWWGNYGMVLGPFYILSNIVNIIEGQIKFWLELRKLGK